MSMEFFGNYSMRLVRRQPFEHYAGIKGNNDCYITIVLSIMVFCKWPASKVIVVFMTGAGMEVENLLSYLCFLAIMCLPDISL